MTSKALNTTDYRDVVNDLKISAHISVEVSNGLERGALRNYLRQALAPLLKGARLSCTDYLAQHEVPRGGQEHTEEFGGSSDQATVGFTIQIICRRHKLSRDLLGYFLEDTVRTMRMMTNVCLDHPGDLPAAHAQITQRLTPPVPGIMPQVILLGGRPFRPKPPRFIYD